MCPDDVADNGDSDVVITDQQLYDHATRAKEPVAEPAPAQPEPAAPAEPAPQQLGQRMRDEQGRFVAGQPQPPAFAEGRQPTQPQQPQQPQQQRQPEDHRVPLRELLDTRERAQRAEAENAQMRQAWQQFQAQQQAYAQQQAMAAQQQQQPQTIFDNPDQYLMQNFVAPMLQRIEMDAMQRTDRQSREFANAQFGAQEVNAALADLTRIRQSPQGDFIFRQVMSAGHPYGALVQWHRQARQQAEVGPDPKAWLNKQLDDPNVQAEAVKRWQAQQQKANGRPPQVNLPPSLSSMPASSGRIEDIGDLSDASLYAHATRARRT